MRLVVHEIERLGQLAVLIDELHAVFLDEMAGLHLRQHAEPLEHPIGLGNQRLADVKARELLALEELHAQAMLGDQCRGGRAGRPAANHDDVGGFRLWAWARRRAALERWSSAFRWPRQAHAVGKRVGSPFLAAGSRLEARSVSEGDRTQIVRPPSLTRRASNSQRSRKELPTLSPHLLSDMLTPLSTPESLEQLFERPEVDRLGQVISRSRPRST